MCALPLDGILQKDLAHMQAQVADPGSLKGSAEPPRGLRLNALGLLPSWSRLAGLPGAVWGWSQVPTAHPVGSCQVHVDSSEAVTVSQAPFPALPRPLALKSTASLPLPQYDQGSV